MGKVERIISGAALIVGGALVGIFTQNWYLALSMASTGIGLLSPIAGVGSDKEGLTDRQGAVLENRLGARESLPVVYGQAKIGGCIAEVRIDPNSTENKRLALVVAWCHGSRDGSGIESYESVYFDDRQAIGVANIIQFPFTQTVPGQLIGSQMVRHLESGAFFGTTAQTVDTRLTALFPTEWPSTSKGAGVAYHRFELWYNPDIYGGGVPTCTAVIKGNKVYDPRNATWAWSDNPALCIRDYLLSSIYGLGIPGANINEQSFIDAANYCDELVTNPDGGTFKRFTLNGWVDTAKPVEQNLAELCTACRGQIVNEGDQWRLVIRRERFPSGYKISEKNTVEGSWQFILPGSQGAANIVRTSYVDPSKNYQVDTVQWPDPGTSNPYLTDDNSYEHRLEIDLPFTNARSRAQQIAMTLMKEMRESIGVICTLHEDALQCRVGDLVEISHPTPGWTDKIFDVAALLLQPDGQVRVVLVEYDPVVYDLDTQFTSPSVPNTNLPNPFSVAAPTSLVLTSQGQALQTNDGRWTPRLRVTWGKPEDPFISYYEVQARKQADTNVTETPFPFASSAFTHSGLTVFDATKVWNDNLTDTAFGTDSAVSGATLTLDCGAGVTKEFIECRIYALAGGSTANFTIEYSDNGSSWTTAASGFVPSANGKNSKTWGSVGAHRYWRIRLTNTPGAGPEFAELKFLEPAWDTYGRILSAEAPLCFVYPASDEQWQVRVCAVNMISVRSAWLSGTHLVVTDDPRPQITSITLANAHADTHSDVAHSDVAHGDAGHSDLHDDIAHDDSHLDMHTDSHTDSHSDSHSDVHGDGDLHMDSHGDSHSDVAHGDANQSDHGDTAHTDNHTDVAHSDSAHTDSHTDAHSDGQYGIGVALQADTDSASVRAVARKYKNYILNGDGEQGTLGSQATSWTKGAGNDLVVANDFAYEGGRSLKIANATAADSYSYQDVALVTGQLYEVSGYIKTDALPAGDAGWGAVLNMDIVSGITSFTIVEKSNVNGDPNASQPDIGIQADGVARDWTRVYCRFTVAANGTVRLYCQLGYSGTQSGTAWFDRVRLEMAEPNAADVRAQPAKNGRNVTIELIDAATGAQLLLNPGDAVRIGALAYSEVQGGGVEGPLALGSGTLFNVAPTGTDKWVPA